MGLSGTKESAGPLSLPVWGAWRKQAGEATRVDGHGPVNHFLQSPVPVLLPPSFKTLSVSTVLVLTKTLTELKEIQPSKSAVANVL